MARTVPTALATALAASPRRGGECLVIEARDGTRVCFTTRDVAMEIDLGLGAGVESCSASMTVSALTLTEGTEASSAEISGPLGGTLTAAAIRGGRWHHARAWLVWATPGETDVVPLLGGRVGEPRVEGGAWVLEIRNGAAALQQTIGRVLSPYCIADFGDLQCGVVRTPYATLVTAVEAGAAGAFRFTVDLAGDHADDFFNLGEVEFTDGALAGQLSGEVFDYVGASGAIELYAPLVLAPEVGDAVTLYRGCSKLMVSEDPSLPTCVSYDNGLRHRGWPDVPGSDLYLKMSPPGAGGA